MICVAAMLPLYLIVPIFGANKPDSAERLGMINRAVGAGRLLVMVRNMNVMAMADPMKLMMASTLGGGRL
ncbi:hypothetical protein B1218_34370 [Pseudomonas ogarae]|nr:hypothetical protein B1218_34370 [Pseudomonas ogarae]